MSDSQKRADEVPGVFDRSSQAYLILLAWVALIASFFFSHSVSESIGGQVTSFVDYGAICGGGAALLICLIFLIVAVSAGGANQTKPNNAWLAFIVGVLALLRVLYGFGLFI
jgi:hypothetical protein